MIALVEQLGAQVRFLRMDRLREGRRSTDIRHHVLGVPSIAMNEMPGGCFRESFALQASQGSLAEALPRFIGSSTERHHARALMPVQPKPRNDGIRDDL